MNYEILNFPWNHGYSKNFLDLELSKKMSLEFPEWDSPIWNEYGKVFKSEYGYKKELTNKSSMPKNIVDFLDKLESSEWITKISNATGIENLFIDKGLYGGGLNIYPPGSYLTTHIDFNYNNELKAYRSVNLIYYLNIDWKIGDGGCFELYDKKLIKQKSIDPKLNTCLFFSTNNDTYHGVSKTGNNFYRKSISIWYYTKEPTKNLSKQPHKTIWIK